MEASISTHSQTDAVVTDRTAGDALVAGLIAMLVMSVGQRLVGLVRNVGFCHFLPDVDLGLWALANSFFLIGAPIAVLGLPGSLGKFVEHYRIQGRLRPYLSQLLLVCAVGILGFSAVILALPEFSSRMLYGESLGFSIIVWTVVCLVCLIIFNTVAELAVSLRLVRLNSLMHLIQTVMFTLLGVAAIARLQTWWVLLPAYAVACMLASLPGALGVWKAVRVDLSRFGRHTSRSMWSRILPFAITVWCMNLLANLFDLSDRYMLLHLSQSGSEAGQALVGQFYCGRILPNLLLSLGMMLGGIVLPYLSADWERKRLDRISENMNNLIVVLSFGFSTISLMGMAFSPLLFEWLLSGRYQAAAEILPLGMTLACWSGMTAVATAYLLCAEKGRQTAFLTGVCLVVNILLNYPLILWMGLFGAALATTMTNGLLLFLVLRRVDREGCSIRRRTLAVSCLPLSLSFGPAVAAVLLMALAVVCGRTNWLLSDDDRAKIDQLLLPYCKKLRLPIASLWSTGDGTG
jgi:polysaccharide transporter, PST family